MLRFALIVAATLLSFSTQAQHSHGSKGPNGGQMEDVADVHAELLVSGTTLTINVIDEQNKPIKTAGFSASALVVNGANRETVSLTQSGEAALKGEVKQPVGKGAQITLMLKTAAGKSGQARFKTE